MEIKKKQNLGKDYRKRLLWHKFPHEEELQEKKLRHEVFLSLWFDEDILKKYKKQLKSTSNVGDIEELKSRIKAHEEHYNKIKFLKGILEKIHDTSKILKEKKVTKEERKYFNEERDKLRKYLDEEPCVSIIKSIEKMRDFSLKK